MASPLFILDRISSTAILVSIAFTMGCRSDGLRYSTSESQVANSTAAISPPEGLDVWTGWRAKVDLFTEAQLHDDAIQATISAIDSWNDAVGYEIIRYAGTVASDRGEELFSSLNDELTVVYAEPEWIETTKKSFDTLATTVWEQGAEDGAIVRGDIVLNTESYVFVDVINSVNEGQFDGSDWSLVVDAQTVLVHEIGHLIGLGHIEEHIDPDSVMHTRTQIGPNNHQRDPSQNDQINVQTLYSPES